MAPERRVQGKRRCRRDVKVASCEQYLQVWLELARTVLMRKGDAALLYQVRDEKSRAGRAGRHNR